MEIASADTENKNIVLQTEGLSIGYRHKNNLEVVAADINLKLYDSTQLNSAS